MTARLSIVFVLSLIGSYILTDALITSRTEYEAYLKSHPYFERMDDATYSAIPKKDRPDLAERQNYLMTMHPTLKRPTPEVLPAIVKQINNYSRQRGPGADATPWIERGPNNVGGRTRAITFDPNDSSGKKVWAGGVTGGLWYNNDITNNSSAWNAVGDLWDNIVISSIAFDPNNSQIIYVGTGESYTGAGRGAGVWKSSDGGATWNQLSATANYYYVNDIAVRNENGSSVLYVGVSAGYAGSTGEDADLYFGLDEEGMQRSTDGGESFTQVMRKISGQNLRFSVSDIEIGADNRIWIGTARSFYSNVVSGGTVLYSDNGTQFYIAYESGNDGRVEIAVAPSDENYIYAILERDDAVDAIIRSTDKGESFTSLSEPNDADDDIAATDFSRGQAYYDLTIQVDPFNRDNVVVGAIDLFYSKNGGASWSQISRWHASGSFWNESYSVVHADQHNIIFSTTQLNTAIFSNDGGVFYTDGLSSASTNDVIEMRNNGYNVTQFYSCDIHPTSSKNTFIAGTQDNGTQLFNSSGINSTTEVTGGDGGFCHINQTNGNVMVSSYTYNNFYYSTDGGSYFDYLDSDNSSGLFINPSDFDDNLNILYAGGSSTLLKRYFDIGNGSPQNYDITLPDLGADISNIKVSPYTTSSSTVFIGTAAGRLYKITNTDNSSASIAEIGASSFPNGWISSVEFGSSEQEIIVTFSNYGLSSIWYTSNGGNSWSEKEGNLVDLPVRWALINPNNEAEVIIATELGVWSTTNFTSSSPIWTPSNSGLATVRVDMLKMRDADKEVIAATHGRGLFSSDGFSQASALSASFIADVETILEGQTVSFSDISSGVPSDWNWTFEGGSPSSSDEMNPSITYNESGTYDVTLTVSNDVDEETITIAEMITVEAIPEGCDSTIANISSVGGLTTYSLNGGYGLVSGHNYYEIAKYAEYFTDLEYNKLSGIQFFTSSADEIDGAANTVTFAVYEDNNGTPGSTLASKTIDLSDVRESNLLNDYVNRVFFDEPVDVDRNVFIGFELDYDNIDAQSFSVSIDPMTSSGNTAYMYYQSDNEATWLPFNDFYGSDGHTSFGIRLVACNESYFENIEVDFEADKEEIDEGFAINFANLSEGANLSYHWRFEGGTPSTSEDRDPLITFDDAGTFDITLIASNGSVTDSLTKEDFIRVIGDTTSNSITELDLNISLYPNPVHSILNIALPANHMLSSIKLEDMVGKIVMKEQTNTNQYQLDLSNLETGIYFIELAVEGQVYRKQLIKD
jgi:PKD repeat protein